MLYNNKSEKNSWSIREACFTKLTLAKGREFPTLLPLLGEQKYIFTLRLTPKKVQAIGFILIGERRDLLLRQNKISEESKNQQNSSSPLTRTCRFDEKPRTVFFASFPSLVRRGFVDFFGVEFVCVDSTILPTLPYSAFILRLCGKVRIFFDLVSCRSCKLALKFTWRVRFWRGGKSAISLFNFGFGIWGVRSEDSEDSEEMNFLIQAGNSRKAAMATRIHNGN
jgi:hypothetical protein